MLLIIFFITHGYAEHVKLIPFGSLFLLLSALLVIGFLLYRLCRWLIKDRQKAALFLSFFLLIFLFFGAFQDFFGRFHFTSALAQLRVFVPVSVAVILLGFILLKTTKRNLSRLRVFLNALLTLSIMIDLAVISVALLRSPEKRNITLQGLRVCDTCARPTIYFILLDEYSGSHALKDFFNYDNSPFEQFLAGQGFKVNQQTTSNYLLTVFSLASTLNMDYIQDLGPASINNHYGYRKAVNSIGDNNVVRFLQQQGYRINNYSYFRLPDAAPEFKADYLPGETDLITHKTMYSRVASNISRVLITKFGTRSLQERADNYYIHNNEAMMQGVLDLAGSDARKTSFTYVHLMMPHDPIAFDSLGNRITPFWARPRYPLKERDDAYLQYLVYTNNRMRNFIKALKEKTKGEAIIMLMSDHGYRRIPLNKALRWQTLNAIYLPQQYQKQSEKWYDGMSNVNQFRVLFNAAFDQELPVLRDSLVK
ncbi:MAG: sulfatase-like hydrolase/transferase [Chitinophagaceae bacterium]